MKKQNFSTLARTALGVLISLLLLASRAQALDNSECLDCHSDINLSKESTDNIIKSGITVSLYVDAEKFNDSVHHRNDISCVDCHSDITELNYEDDLPHNENLEPVCCAGCHDEEGEAFKKSVHMEILKKGITMTCYACHGYHDVKQMEGALLAERENNYCLKCHNPYRYHEWLPEMGSHFALVECVVCHAPEVPQQIHLHFVDLVTNQLYEGTEILTILGISADDFMPLLDTNQDNIIDQAEFEALVLMLRQKGIHARFHAELVADLMPPAHEVTKGMAEKTCEKCHAANSPYFDAVFFLFKRQDGSIARHKVDRSILQSYAMSHFYLMSGTRVKLLDKIGFLLMAAGAAAILLHLVIRVATFPARQNNSDHGH